jgi:glycosyltransferase involved in cell wall biosynthesis
VHRPATLPLAVREVLEEAVEVSVVMPCLNEEDTVGSCVERALEALRHHHVAGEVIVVDNGSSDRSIEVAARAGARVLLEPARGYGNAYLTGLRAARGDYLIIGDSDGTYSFDDIPRLLERLRHGADLVIGSRLRGTILPKAMPWSHRYIGTPLLTGLLNIIAGTHLSDAHSGFRGFTREAYSRMGLLTGGMEFASEMLVKAAASRLQIAEVPIHYYPRQGRSKLRPFRDAYRHLRFLLLHSPFHLFLVPGAIMLAVGLLLQLTLVWGPIRLGALFMDFHFMIVGALLVLLGYQVLSLGLFADIYKKAIGSSINGPTPIGVVDRFFTLERGLVTGAVMTLVGLSLFVWILYEWLIGGGGFDTNQRLRQSLLGMTFVVLGLQTIFSAALVGLQLGFLKEPEAANGRFD